MGRKFALRNVADRTLHTQRVRPLGHGEDQMKGVAGTRLRRDRRPAMLPFRFQIGHRFLPDDELAVLVFQIQLTIS